MNIEGLKNEINFLLRHSLFDLPAMRDRKAKRAGIRYPIAAQTDPAPGEHL
jgi:hypothetical protein